MENQPEQSIFDEINLEQPYFEYATAGQRFINLLIDTVIFYIVYFVVIIVIGAVLGLTATPAERVAEIFSNQILLYSIAIIVMVVTYTLIESITKGRSVGKYVTRTKVVTEEFLPIGFHEALIRSLCRVIPFEWVSMINGRPLHDSISKTNVIKNTRYI